MAIYRLFPESDAFISTRYPLANAGMDEILEVSSYRLLGVSHTHRTLVKFSTADIQDVVDNKVGSDNFSASLGLYLATATGMPTSYTLNCLPVYESWENGVGKFEDVASDTSGVCWNFRQAYATGSWKDNQSELPAGVTFFTSSAHPAGGNWYTGSNGVNLTATQTHGLRSDHDASFDVTNAVRLHYSSSIDNNGFIIKLQDSLEFSATSSRKLHYFGADTHTIYPPYLDIKWTDFTYSTSSLNSRVSTSDAIISVKNNKGQYRNSGIQRFRVAARPKYPPRVFTTSSIYLTEYYLPKESYWGLLDENTEEMVVDFDNTFTQLSGDTQGNYFDVFMDGLEPERYYRILIKTTLDSSTVIVSDPNIFKVVRNA